MPNKCTKCGKLHSDDAQYLLETGCDACGGRLFFFIRQEMVIQAEKDLAQLSKKEMKEIETDIMRLVPKIPMPLPAQNGQTAQNAYLSIHRNALRPSSAKNKRKKQTVVLDIEAIRVIKPGKYLIDVKNLLSQKPVIIKIGAGKYEIDLSMIEANINRK